MNVNMLRQLVAIGLTETEASLYLCGIVMDNSAGVQDLQKATNIKRSTIYHALHTLAEKGLVSKKTEDGKTLHNFSEPAQLQSFVRSRMLQERHNLDKAQSLIQELSRIDKQTKSTHTKVEHYEGIEGVKSVVESALNCVSGKWDILAPKKNFFSEFDVEYAQYFMNTRRRKGITSRSLWEVGFKSSGDSSERFVDDRNPRYLPEIMTGKYESVMIIYDKKVAIISSLQGLNAIILESEEVHGLFQAMFNGLWAISTPYSLNSSKLSN